MKRKLIGLVAVLACVGGALTMTAAPAHAATSNGWRWFDVQTNDPCGGDYAIWVYNGNYQPYAWFDLNNDCYPDSYFLDTNNDGRFDQFWFDNIRTDSNWDTLIYGNMRWENQNQTPFGGYSQITGGPDDPTRSGNVATTWASQNFTSSTLGGTSPSNATAGGAFYNLMTALAAKSGVSIWDGVPRQI